MFPSGHVAGQCGCILRIYLMVVWVSLVPHRRHRGETGVCRHGDKAGQDDTVHGEAGFDIG